MSVCQGPCRARASPAGAPVALRGWPPWADGPGRPDTRSEGWKAAALVSAIPPAPPIALRWPKTCAARFLALNRPCRNFENGVRRLVCPDPGTKLLSLNPLSAPPFAVSATPAKVRRRSQRTGDASCRRRGLALYHRLAPTGPCGRDPGEMGRKGRSGRAAGRACSAAGRSALRMPGTGGR